MRHSRLFLELLAERTKDPLKAEAARVEIAKIDKRERTATRRVSPREIAPAAEPWLDAWLAKAAPYLVSHKQEERNEEERRHVRLIAGAPVADLAGETRLRINLHGSGMHEVFFPSKVSRDRALSFIQSRQA